jgi:hypothetical protein
MANPIPGRCVIEERFYMPEFAALLERSLDSYISIGDDGMQLFKFAPQNHVGAVCQAVTSAPLGRPIKLRRIIMNERQIKAAGTIGLAIGATAAAKTLAIGQGDAFGLTARQTTAVVGLGALIVVAVLAARTA